MPFDIPLPKIVADVEAGGPFATTMKGLNALTKQNLEAHQQRLESKYYPQKTMAQVASQLAYANLMGPQYLAKLMQNPDFVANLSEEQKDAIKNMVTKAGMNQTNLTQNLTSPMAGQNAMQQSTPQPPFQAPAMPPSNALIQNGQRGYEEQLTPEQQNQINKIAPGNTYIPELNAMNQNNPQVPPSIEAKPTYAEQAGTYKGVIKEGETLGGERGKTISEIGKQQLALSESGNVLDHLANIITNPIFKNMRSEIPFFQDKQLSVLSKIGTPEQQRVIGDFISSLQAFKASTVNGFKGRTLEKEFGLADKIKFDENDTMGVIEGKYKSLKTLKDVAQAKNDFIIDLMSGPRHLNLGQAVKEANKMIDYKAIEKDIENALNPPAQTVTIKNKKTGEQRTISITEARKLGVPNV